MIPGELFIKDGELELNAGRKTVTLTVANSGDRPIQVGSHYHFFETNPALKFDRKKARGMRLDIAAGTAVRFEPGQTRDVQLVALAGKRVITACAGRAGELFIKDGEIELNAGRKTVTLNVANTGDRPIQVGSHYHFFETNPALKFDRKKARGMRLDIAAGTAVRFEPARPATCNWSRSPASASSTAFAATCRGNYERKNQAFRLCRHVRSDHRRQGAARRYRSHHRGGKGFHHLRRGGEVRRRQGDPRRHGAVPSH